jgi:hypothetical protein
MAKSNVSHPLIKPICIASNNYRDLISRHLGRTKRNDHSNIDKFQTAICDDLNVTKSEYKWKTEVKPRGRSERDSVDIFGENDSEICIIEIDAARGDQVAKKAFSRTALWGLNKQNNKAIIYIALLYPHKTANPIECEKYVRFANSILKKINSNSMAIAIYIGNNYIEIWDFNKTSSFTINGGNDIVGLTKCAKEAVKKYISSKGIKRFSQLKKVFGKYVDTKSGPSRYSQLTTMPLPDGNDVFVYSQWREFGLGCNWDEFVNLCKDYSIRIEKKYNRLTE